MAEFETLQEKKEAWSHGNFYEIVSRSPDAIVILNQQGIIRYANPASSLLFGRSVSGLIGKDFGWPVTSDLITEIDILKQGSASTVAEMQVVKIDWEGEPALLATLRDMSDRIKLARELARSNKDLGEFAHVISNDIKAPLRTVNLLSQWLYDGNRQILSQEALDDLDLISKTSKRMYNMVDDLLQYSKVNNGDRKFTEVSLDTVCKAALDNLSEDVFRTDALVSWESMPAINGDESQLLQLFQNIISNSLKYCAVRPIVNIECLRENYFWHFTITDNGIGVESRYLESVFKPFSHLQKEDVHDGSGIGLATCEKIVERHKGRIWLESEYGNGSVMHLILPAGFDNPEGKRLD
ncbi:MAG: ATP-binding protein [Granulosicoccus sp.]